MTLTPMYGTTPCGRPGRRIPVGAPLGRIPWARRLDAPTETRTGLSR
jgi:hypothetical protein